MRAYLSDVVLLYLDELIDWESYFNWRRGEASDLDVANLATVATIEKLVAAKVAGR